MTIEIGNVVKLKSGGPPMTVLSRYQNQWICEWFNAKNERVSDAFAETSLQVITDPGGGDRAPVRSF